MAKRTPSEAPPDYEPQLATLVEQPPEGEGWLYELKYDGYRMGLWIHGDEVAVLSRRGRAWTRELPELGELGRCLGVRSALVDGELAVVDRQGRTDFQALQNALGRRPPRKELVYFAFDLLCLDGEDLSGRPLLERKRRLRAVVSQGGCPGLLRYSEHLLGDGARMFEQACRLGAEGIVCKQRDAPYRPGRGPSWLKVKCTLRQELVVGGFTLPEGSRQGLGALLVGYHDAHGGLRFAGKVGTGFSQKSAKALRERLDALGQTDCPFQPRPPGWLGKHGLWVRPELVCEVTFTEWTSDGVIRHPSFQGLREDRDPREVRREVPAPMVEPAAAKKKTSEVLGVTLSHPGRRVFDTPPLTKLEVACYYEAVAEWMVPHLRGRPLTLVRCADKVPQSCEYMKHSKVWAPEALARVRIPEKTKTGEYLIADDAKALVSLAQMDVVELHTWNSRWPKVELPDRVVIDLDPGPQVRFGRVVEAAFLVRALVESLGLGCFLKSTGGLGLHLVVPLLPQARWEECLEFSRQLAAALVRYDPKRFTLRYAKAGRERRILIDYLRNNRTNTSVAAYSLRARPNAPISVPLGWDELSKDLRPWTWGPAWVKERLGRLRVDPWTGYHRAAASLRSVTGRAAARNWSVAARLG